MTAPTTGTPHSPLVSLVLPARNEAGTVAEVIHRARRALNVAGLAEHEIILVDSASTDGTAAVAVAADAGVRVVRVREPGKGRALSAGFRRARGRVLAFIDSDLDLAPEDIPNVLRPVLAGSAVAVARKTGQVQASRPILRRVGSRVVNAVAGAVLGTGVRDHQTGLKVFQGRVLRAVLPHVQETGWLWDTEVIWRIVRRGGNVVEVPVALRGARPGHLQGWRQEVGALGQAGALCVRLTRERSATAVAAVARR
jgi:glycosyltransferase involved in cell wall biosynthesis